MSEELKTEELFNVWQFDELQEECRDFILQSACSLIIDHESGQIVYITPEAESNFGYIPNELIGQQLEVLIEPELKEKHIQHRHEGGAITEGRQMAYGRSVNARLKDGSTRAVYIRLTSKYIINKRKDEKRLWTKADLIFTPHHGSEFAGT